MFHTVRPNRKHRKHVCTSCTPSNTPFNSSGHREIPPRHSSHVTSRHVTSHQPSAAVSASASSPERRATVSACVSYRTQYFIGFISSIFIAGHTDTHTSPGSINSCAQYALVRIHTSMCTLLMGSSSSSLRLSLHSTSSS